MPSNTKTDNNIPENSAPNPTTALPEGKFETIGKVTLDLTHYPGEDYYCDGEIEDELLAIVKDNPTSDYRQIIEEKKNWPVLYHLSELRQNIVSWLPEKDAKILEIGSGCGAITGALARKARELTCVDLSKKRSMINAYRHQELSQVTIRVGNFQDIEPHLDTDYDLICLIGVFEYAQGYIGADAPYTKFLDIIRRHLKKDGRIVIAIENRIGMKYFAGCQEDHLGTYFSGIEDYPEGGVVRTFSRPRLEEIFRKCDIGDYSFYYPYPDYKFAHTIYSDQRLPGVGELTTNLCNYDRERLLLFDEKIAWDSVIRDGLFPLFSNSFLVVLGPAYPAIYTKFSNDRSNAYAIRTDIIKTQKLHYVTKQATKPEAKAHMQAIAWAQEQLEKRYEGSDLQICKCSWDAETLRFPYLEGITLEEKLDRCLSQNDMEGFEALFERYLKLISFGEGSGVTDLDLIFPNILIAPDDTWQVIDYEWTVDETISYTAVAKRALYCYLLGGGMRLQLDAGVLAEKFGLGSFEMEEQKKEEVKFQNKVTGSYRSLSDMRHLIHNQVYPLSYMVETIASKKRQHQVQIYINRGAGFSEADSFIVEPERMAMEENGKDNRFQLVIPLEQDWKQLRFDPAMEPCVVLLKKAEMTQEGEDLKGHTTFGKKNICHNGTVLGGQTFVFPHEDPNITFELSPGKEKKTLTLCYEIEKVSLEMANAMIPKKLFGK